MCFFEIKGIEKEVFSDDFFVTEKIEIEWKNEWKRVGGMGKRVVVCLNKSRFFI